MSSEGETKFSLLLWLCIKSLKADCHHAAAPQSDASRKASHGELLKHFCSWGLMDALEWVLLQPSDVFQASALKSLSPPPSGNVASLSLQGSLILYTTNAKINGIILINLNFGNTMCELTTFPCRLILHYIIPPVMSLSHSVISQKRENHISFQNLLFCLTPF